MAKTAPLKKTFKGSKIPVANLSKKSGVPVIQRKPVPNFKKLHSKWENKLELAKLHSTNLTICQEFQFSKSRTKATANKENISTSSSNSNTDKLFTAAQEEEGLSSCSEDGTTREYLSTIPVVHKEFLKSPQSKKVSKMESQKDVEFEVDEHALQSILSNTGVRDARLLCRTPSNAGIRDARLLYRSPSIINKAASQMPRSSIYTKFANEPYTFAPSLPKFRVPFRNSIYQKVDRPSVFGRFSVTFKSPVSAIRAPCAQNTNSRLKTSNSAVRILQPQKKEKPSVKWADILSPEYPISSMHCTTEEKSQVSTRLFADDKDVDKLKNIEEVEKQLENEIKQLETRKVLEKLEANSSQTTPCHYVPQHSYQTPCRRLHSSSITAIPSQPLMYNASHNYHGGELAHITNHLNGIHLTPHPCHNAHFRQQNITCCVHHPVELHNASCSCCITPCLHYAQHCCNHVGMPPVLKQCSCAYNHRTYSVDSNHSDNSTNHQESSAKEYNHICGDSCAFFNKGKSDSKILPTQQDNQCLKSNPSASPTHGLVDSKQEKDYSYKCFVENSSPRLQTTHSNSSEENSSCNKRESFLQKTPGRIFLPEVVKSPVGTVAEDEQYTESTIVSQNQLNFCSVSMPRLDLGSEKSHSSNAENSIVSNNINIKCGLDSDPKNYVETDSALDFNIIKSKLGRESYLLRRSCKSPKSTLGRALINSTNQKFYEALIDEECALYACQLKVKYNPQSATDRDCKNPLAQVLTEGDAVHFIPVEEQKSFSKSEMSAFKSYAS